MRRKVQVPTFSSEEPPADLLRYPMPAVGGYAGFEDWLRTRRHWRQTHERLLPELWSRDRHALNKSADLDPELVREEKAAPKAPPEWVARAEAMRSSSGRGIGPLPVVARPGEPPRVPPVGGAE